VSEIRLTEETRASLAEGRRLGVVDMRRKGLSDVRKRQEELIPASASTGRRFAMKKSSRLWTVVYDYKTYGRKGSIRGTSPASARPYAFYKMALEAPPATVNQSLRSPTE